MAALAENMATPTRRSGRTRNPPMKYEDQEELRTPPRKATAKRQASAETPRRNTRPKRRAAEAALENIATEDTAALQEQVLARMDVDERKEYRGWVQLESEPAFFNAMLQDLGAKDLKVQEIFGLDEAMLADLPKPVFGLIFLYEWTGDDTSGDARQKCPENLWFGNQTTANACATVALMNIIMNIHSVKFGPELEAFRERTRTLSPPHRGHALDTNDFIRAIHNSVARRTDLLSEDLLLDNKYQEHMKKKRPTAKRKTPTKSARKKDDEPGTYHYIAFVPVDGQVWELDGLETEPLCLGKYQQQAGKEKEKEDETDSWLKIASTAIQTRMANQDNEYLSFNLLATCQSPLLTTSQQLGKSLATSLALANLHNWPLDSIWGRFTDDEYLARFGLTREKILANFSPHKSFKERANRPDFDIKAAERLAEELRTEQDSLDARHAAELATVDEAIEMIRGRRRDYTPAIHKWVRILAEKGVLEDLIRDVDAAGQAR
ncbi:cysteine proteinase [Poronia punctata]|nr:cysteine proteinase [Poronia punctata]